MGKLRSTRAWICKTWQDGVWAARHAPRCSVGRSSMLARVSTRLRWVCGACSCCGNHVVMFGTEASCSSRRRCFCMAGSARVGGPDGAAVDLPDRCVARRSGPESASGLLRGPQSGRFRGGNAAWGEVGCRVACPSRRSSFRNASQAGLPSGAARGGGWVVCTSSRWRSGGRACCLPGGLLRRRGWELQCRVGCPMCRAARARQHEAPSAVVGCAAT